MANLEIQPKSPQQKNIPGFHGFELVKDKIDVLKEGAFAKFMQKVAEYRSDPQKMEQLKKDFMSFEKKKDADALRAGGLSCDPIDGPARLFAMFGEKILFEKDGMRVQFNFHGMKFAQKCIGTGHVFPGSVSHIEKNGKVSGRGVGRRGPEYHSVKNRQYQAIYSNTEIFIRYRDIVVHNAAATLEKDKIEKKYTEKHLVVAQKTQQQLRQIAQTAAPAIALKAPTSVLPQKIESKERYQPQSVLVLGDSQIGGLAGHLQKGMRNFHKNGGTIADVMKIAKRHPEAIKNAKLIYIQAGGNDVWGANSEKMKKDMQILSSYIRGINSGVRLVVGTIPPREEVIARRKPARAEKIRTAMANYNEWVRSNFETFDVNRLMAIDTSGHQNPEYKRKGSADVHFNKKGYMAYAKAFEEQFHIGGEV